MAVQHGAQRMGAGQHQAQPARARRFPGDRSHDRRLGRQLSQRHIQRCGERFQHGHAVDLAHAALDLGDPGHGQAVTVAPDAPETVNMSQRRDRYAAHCPGWPLQPQRCFASRCAHAVIAEPGRTASTPFATIHQVSDEGGAEQCSFCGKHRHQVAAMASTGDARICGVCLELCDEIIEESPVPPR